MKDRQPDPNRQVDLAINRVLAAEQAAREAVEQCREAAAALVTRAGERAQAVGAATERRVRLAHRLADQGIERALTALHESGTGDEPPPEPDPRRLTAVVARLAEELTAAGSRADQAAGQPPGGGL